MWAEQAIFTSLQRKGRSGYHIVARSPGVSDADERDLTHWCPSHGALIVDAANHVSVNFHPLSAGRFALSRSCQGRPEYSGRGGRQVYTHVLIIDESHLRRADYQTIALYRAALALGYFTYDPDPPTVLQKCPLSVLYPPRNSSCWATQAKQFGVADLDDLQLALRSGRSVQYRFSGDRAALVECLLNLMPSDQIPGLSFSTSLMSSQVRPYRLALL